MSTYYTGAAQLNTLNQDMRVIDMANQIPFLAPRITPFLFLAQRPTIEFGQAEKGAKSISFNYREVFNVEYKWMEDQLRDMQTTASAAFISTDLNITVAVSNVFQIGDLVLVVATGEIIRVDELNHSTLTVKVTRAFGTTIAGAIANGGTLLIIGNVNAENARSRSTSDIIPVTKTNYIQTTKNPFDGSDKTQQVELYGIPDYRMYKRNTKFLEHLYNIESSLLFAEPKLGTEYGGTSMENSTGGVFYHLTQNVKNAAGALTKADFEDWLADVFEYGSDEKFLFCGSNVSKAISKFAGDMSSAPVSTVYVQNLATTFGIKIRTYVSDNGILHIVRHGLLKGATYGGYGFVVDPKQLKVVRLKKGDWMKLYTDIQENDRTGWKDEYRSDFGFQYQLIKTGGVIKGVTG